MTSARASLKRASRDAGKARTALWQRIRRVSAEQRMAEAEAEAADVEVNVKVKTEAEAEAEA